MTVAGFLTPRNATPTFIAAGTVGQVMNGGTSAVTEEVAAALIAAIPDAVVVIDERGEVQYINGAFGDLFGYAPEEVLGEPVTRIIPEGLWGRHEQSLERYVETGERRIDWSWIEFPALHADGREFLDESE